MLRIISLFLCLGVYFTNAMDYNLTNVCTGVGNDMGVLVGEVTMKGDPMGSSERSDEVAMRGAGDDYMFFAASCKTGMLEAAYVFKVKQCSSLRSSNEDRMEMNYDDLIQELKCDPTSTEHRYAKVEILATIPQSSDNSKKCVKFWCKPHTSGTPYVFQNECGGYTPCISKSGSTGPTKGTTSPGKGTTSPGKGTTKPNKGKGTTKPNKGKGTTKPNKGKGTTKPNKGKGTTMPKGTTNPKATKAPTGTTYPKGTKAPTGTTNPKATKAPTGTSKPKATKKPKGKKPKKPKGKNKGLF